MSVDLEAFANRLSEFQEEHRAWREKNFPEAEPWEALVGLQEELGELAHAHLKGKYGIRGMEGLQLAMKKADSVGDIFIYLVSYCSTNDLDIGQCIASAWVEVHKRDWLKNKETGVDSGS